MPPEHKIQGMSAAANPFGLGTESPYIEVRRREWAELAPSTALPLRESELHALRGLGDQLDLHEVAEVYHPLSRLLNLYAGAARRLHRETSDFLGERASRTPFIIAVAGSVAVGKSTIARLLRELLSRWEDTPRVELVTTDGFLYPNAELEARGIMHRKGFPESYDQRALVEFVAAIKAGAAEVRAPFYSHLAYDIVPSSSVIVRRPDILILEGLNVLQPPRPGTELALSDLFDFSIYVDAEEAHVAQWYESRFLKLQRGAFTNPNSYFHRYASLTEDEALARARELWSTINAPNLRENIEPTRSRATLVLRKDADHTVQTVLLRKL